MPLATGENAEFLLSAGCLSFFSQDVNQSQFIWEFSERRFPMIRYLLILIMAHGEQALLNCDEIKYPFQGMKVMNYLARCNFG